MIYTNNPQLRGWLEKDFPQKALLASFDLTVSDYEGHYRDLARRPESERADAAAFRCLTFGKPPEKVAQGFSDVLARLDRGDADLIERFNGIHEHVKTTSAISQKRAWIRAAITWALILLLMLLFAVKGHAQNTNPAIVVATCGTAPANFPAAGQRAPNTVDVNGNQCAGVSVSATIATAGLAISVSTGASTAGVVVTPVAGMVSTGAPTYTTGTVRELSLDTAGALRVNAAVSVPGALSVSTTTGGNGGQVAVVGAVSDGTTASFAPIQIAGIDDAGKIQTIRTTAAGNTVVSLETTSGSIGTVTVTDGAGALNVIVDSGTLTSITNTVTVQGTTGGVAVTMAASSGGTITAVPMNQNGVKTGGQICDSTGANCATITGNKLDVNATVSAAANQIVSTIAGGNGGQVATVGARSSGTAVTFGPVFTGGKDDSGNLEAIRTTAAGNTVVSLETTSGVIGHIVADSGSTTAVTGTVTVQGTTGGVAVTMAGTSGGTITTIPLNQNGVRVGSQICNSAGDACATITGNKLDVNATVSANANQTVSTLTGGNGGQVAVVGAISDGTTASFAPIQIAGVDDAGKIQTLRSTAAGNAVVSLETTSGVIGHIVADSGSTTVVTGTVVVQGLTGGVAVTIAGQTAGTISTIVTDTTGRQVVVGAAASGQIAQGAPVLIGGSDGTNVRSLKTATDGTLQVGGTVSVTDGAGALNVIVDSGAVTVSGTTGGVAVTIAGTSGGTITTIPVNQNGVVAGGPICNTVGDACVTVTGNKLDVNAAVSLPGTLQVNTSLSGTSGVVTVVGSASDGTTATFSPVQIAGKDDAGLIQTIRATAAGNTVVSLETTSGVIGHVVCDSGCTPGGSFADNSAFTISSSSINNAGGVFNDTTADLTAGNAAAQRITKQRAGQVNLRDANGLELGTAFNPVSVQIVTAARLPTTSTSIPAGSQILGTFNRPVQSTNDALNVNVVNVADPCSGPKGSLPISQAASTVLITQNPGRVYVCGVLIIGADAENVSLVEGTGTTCGTSTAAMLGGTTAATGPNLAANGGFNTQLELIQKNPGFDVCLLQSGSGRVAGALSYVIR